MCPSTQRSHPPICLVLRWGPAAATIAALSACMPSVPAANGHGAGADAVAADGIGCRPALSGELRLLEVAVRPGALDLDGDGFGTPADEYLEVWHAGSEPAHAAGVALIVAGSKRGVILSPACLAPGRGAIVVGKGVHPTASPPQVPVLELSTSLRLPDGGAALVLRSVAGGIHDGVSVPAAPPDGAWVLLRAPETDLDAPWRPHSEVGFGRPWSPGRCHDGPALDACLSAAARGGKNATAPGAAERRRP